MRGFLSSPAQAISEALQSPRFAMIGAAGYLLVGTALFGALGLSVGWVTAALSGIALVLGAMLPGAMLVRILMPNRGLLHFVVLGTVVGLMVWAIGGFLSHLTGVFVVRWIPTVVAAGLFIALRVSGKLPSRDRPRQIPLLGIVGAATGVVAMIPSLRTALSTQPTTWDGWVSVVADLPFQAEIGRAHV